jgi:ABC-type amino acid transport substrate-binding protein
MKIGYILLTIICTICVVSQSLGQQLKGHNWSEIKKNGSGTIIFAYVETPGFVYKDPAGRLTGICIDVMVDFVKYVEETHEVKINAKFLGTGDSFRAMYDGVKNGRNGVFGLGNITITEARKKEVKFSPSYITNFAILISQNNVPTLNNMADFSNVFKGLKAYTAKGTLNEKRIMDLKMRYNPNLEINYASSSPETLIKVLDDKNSFSYLDLAFYIDAVKNKKPIKRHPAGDQSSEEFGFIMPMTSDWQPLMEEFFEANGGYKNSTSYKKILVEHLGASAVRMIHNVQNPNR